MSAGWSLPAYKLGQGADLSGRRATSTDDPRSFRSKAAPVAATRGRTNHRGTVSGCMQVLTCSTYLPRSFSSSPEKDDLAAAKPLLPVYAECLSRKQVITAKHFFSAAMRCSRQAAVSRLRSRHRSRSSSSSCDSTLSDGKQANNGGSKLPLPAAEEILQDLERCSMMLNDHWNPEVKISQPAYNEPHSESKSLSRSQSVPPESTFAIPLPEELPSPAELRLNRINSNPKGVTRLHKRQAVNLSTRPLSADSTFQRRLCSDMDDERLRRLVEAADIALLSSWDMHTPSTRLSPGTSLGVVSSLDMSWNNGELSPLPDPSLPSSVIRGDSEDFRLQQAQVLFSEMLTPPRASTGPSSHRSSSQAKSSPAHKRPRSRPGSMPPLSYFEEATDPSVHDPSQAYSRDQKLKRSSSLQPLNGSLPWFPGLGHVRPKMQREKAVGYQYDDMPNAQLNLLKNPSKINDQFFRTSSSHDSPSSDSFKVSSSEIDQQEVKDAVPKLDESQEFLSPVAFTHEDCLAHDEDREFCEMLVAALRSTCEANSPTLPTTLGSTSFASKTESPGAAKYSAGKLPGGLSTSANATRSEACASQFEQATPACGSVPLMEVATNVVPKPKLRRKDFAQIMEERRSREESLGVIKFKY